MENGLSKAIEESTNEVISLIRFQVEEILSLYHTEYDANTLNFNLRNKLVMDTYGVIRKKYLHLPNFENDKVKIVQVIINEYLKK